MAGMRLIWVFGLAGVAAIGLMAAYYTVPHVARRIQRFLDPGSGDTFNIDLATDSFVRGGWFGRGPGEGTVKRLLPESHTDFVFAVAAEEFGVALCLVLVALFAFIVVRALARAMRNDDAFTRFAAAGLAILFGLQSAINMSVNLHLIPAKGMTLPFISYGGSSMISLAYAMGMLLALTREQPRAAMLFARIGGRPGARSDAIHRAACAAGGRRHRRSSFSGGGAGERLAKARRHRRSRHRLSRRAFRLSRPRRSRHSERDLARPQSIRACAHRGAARARHRQGLGAARAHQTRRGGRLRRLSERAAAVGGLDARHTKRAARTKRRHGPRQPRAGAARDRDRHRLSHFDAARSALAGQSHLHRQSDPRRSHRGGGDALCRAGGKRKIAPGRVRRQPGRARHGGDRAGGDRKT